MGASPLQVRFPHTLKAEPRIRGGLIRISTRLRSRGRAYLLRSGISLANQEGGNDEHGAPQEHPAERVFFLPFSQEYSPGIRGENNQGDEHRPAQADPQAAQSEGASAIDEDTRNPDGTHREDLQGVAECPRRAESSRALVRQDSREAVARLDEGRRRKEDCPCKIGPYGERVASPTRPAWTQQGNAILDSEIQCRRQHSS